MFSLKRPTRIRGEPRFGYRLLGGMRETYILDNVYAGKTVSRAFRRAALFSDIVGTRRVYAEVNLWADPREPLILHLETTYAGASVCNTNVICSVEE